MILSDLLKDLAVKEVKGETNIDIQDIQFDSRQVKPGTLFVAQPGTVVDGHDYIDKAIEAGAAAIVCERTDTIHKEGATVIVVDNASHALGLIASAWNGYPSRHLTLVGVTGTNGKTTIATLLYKMVRAMGHKAGLLSTVVNYVNDEPVQATHTTPDALELNGLLKQMVDAGCRYAFMEVSSHAIAQQRIAGLDFDGALFTNLTRDHIDFHKTFENYRDTKKQLFDNLKKDAFAVTNKDDKNGLVMTQNCKAAIHTYSTRSLSDYKARILEEGFDGMLLEVNGMEVFVRLVGRFNVSNLLCIYGAAVCLGFEPAEVLRVLSTLSAVNGRFEAIHSPKGWTAIVDYAHTPDAVENVLNTINEIRKPASKVITVVGCGGNRDKGKRPMMASIAKKNSTQLILTSDNPRDEEPKDILSDMIAGLSPEEQQQTLVIEDRETAIKTACMLAGKDDVILIAGKGHEDYQIIKGVKHHFDDHEIVKANL
ncbi:MAG: UDP-N-acetylmuramoyl-L-alanyl-D-glutamate--2,6-diaminopimelate ligase [Bacteroidales bacterium]|jgi:UDP-N-acetylmuramoyl-L-alanyl-D-glutamate--2,6-diaminopimelate ligase|nr:UDP-N-acetylmuramoyl-L-alanyl-D-glutamate--2,6-diaminopimelate ligase [Bacteroidales bacterium]